MQAVGQSTKRQAMKMSGCFVNRPNPSQMLAWLQDFCDREGWLGLGDDYDLVGLTATFVDRFAGATTILLAEPDPVRFLAAFLAGVTGDRALFLGNPCWQQHEWQQVFALVQPEIVIGSVPETTVRAAAAPSDSKATGIMIPTGGSSGTVRFAMHEWETLAAAVEGVYYYFDRQPLHSYCVLPLFHVSGLMQFLRAVLTGGKFVCKPYKALRKYFQQQLPAGNLPTLSLMARSRFFISLVPTQLQQLLDVGAGEWLAGFGVVLLGGAPPWESLLIDARKHQIPLGLTYGMTETAAQIATLKPVDFLQGNASSGRVLPHARIKIATDRPGEPGRIAIAAASLCRGYYPDTFADSQWFLTDDLGWRDRAGYLHISGRYSRKIITGGENVMPEEVEAAIRATGLVADVCVVAIPDRQWGEAIAALYVAATGVEFEAEQLRERLQLARYKHPKHWLVVREIPRSDRGKIDFAACTALAAEVTNTVRQGNLSSKVGKGSDRRMRIRRSEPKDVKDILSIHRSAFSEEESPLIIQLVNEFLCSSQDRSILSYVAEENKQIVAHVIFSEVIIENRVDNSYILAPLAVLPSWQRKGIGRSLVTYGISELEKLQAKHVFVYGDPNYYSKFGFKTNGGELYLPPYPLQLPHGWQHLGLTSGQLPQKPVKILCLKPLLKPELW